MPSLLSSIRRTTRVIICTGILWLISCWAWVIHRMLTSPPPVTPLLNPLSKKDQYNLQRQLDQFAADDRSGGKVALQNGHETIRTKDQELPATEIKTRESDTAINDAPPLSTFIFPLHEKSGTHHVYLYIGSPPQRQTLIVDTGSRLTAFPCRPHCSACGVHASPRFDMNQSTTLSVVPCDECLLNKKDSELQTYFRGDGVGGTSGDGDVNVDLMPDSANGPGLRGAKRRASCSTKQCEINQKYTEGSSWNAFEVKDNVWLGVDEVDESKLQHDQYSRPFVFGCQTSEEGLFKSQYADGIMGLSMYTQTIVGSWYKHGSITHDSFSLCFNSKGGHMSLGGTASNYDRRRNSGARHLEPMQFIPLSRENTWYYTVTVTSISVGEHVLPAEILQYLNDQKGTIVDSGTTDTFLSHKVAKAFLIAWAKIVGRKYTNKLQLYSYDQFMQLPTITFEFDGGAKWDVRPEAYMEAAENNDDSSSNTHVIGPWSGKRGFTSRLYVDEPHGAVLGSNMMIDHDLYFDTANRRLGVARAECAF